MWVILPLEKLQVFKESLGADVLALWYKPMFKQASWILDYSQVDSQENVH